MLKIEKKFKKQELVNGIFGILFVFFLVNVLFIEEVINVLFKIKDVLIFFLLEEV